MFVNAIMYYKVKDATSAVANVDDYSGSSRLLAATTLRNILGTRNLGDILSERESIATEMKVCNIEKMSIRITLSIFLSTLLSLPLGFSIFLILSTGTRCPKTN